LLEREKQLIRQLDTAYELQFNKKPQDDVDLIYFLGDRFEFAKTWSATSRQVPCYRKNTGRYVHRASMTFMAPQDKLSSLGWPVTKAIAEEMGCTPVPSLDVKKADTMCGNSVHLSVATIVLLVATSCFGRAGSTLSGGRFDVAK